MQKNKLNLAMAAVLPAVCMSPFHVSAADYEVLSGTFFMDTVTPAPVPITGDGTRPPLPGFPLVGQFSDGAFTADYTCAGQNPAQASVCQGASGTGPDATASVNGLATFDFFGNPVYTYFAANGVDAPDPDHPPPQIDLGTMTAEMASFYANWNGTEFSQGSIDPDSNNQPPGDVTSTLATISDNLNGSYRVTWSSLIVGGPFDGKTGDWKIDICPAPCTLIPPAKAPSLQASQGGQATWTFVQGVGDATISLNASFNQAGIDFLWDNTADELDAGAGNGVGFPASNTGNSLTIDQTEIDAATPGLYPVILNVTDTSETPNQRASATLMIRIVASGAVPDSDHDGIPDASDSITDPTILQTDPSTETEYLMTASSGNLKLGNTAFCSAQTTAAVTVPDIEAFGGLFCAPTSNSVDNVGTVQVGIGGYFDFEVHDVTRGERVDVVIPLKEPIPVNAGYRKFTFFAGWQAFNQDTGDTVMSAPGSPGTCPAIGDAAWEDGLIQGYNCVKLSISDGGPNDSDRAADGIIKDPGTMTSNPPINTAALDIGGLGLSTLAGLLGWFGLARQKARRGD